LFRIFSVFFHFALLFPLCLPSFGVQFPVFRFEAKQGKNYIFRFEAKTFSASFSLRFASTENERRTLTTTITYTPTIPMSVQRAVRGSGAKGLKFQLQNTKGPKKILGDRVSIIKI
jgi:hypothetical protein